MSATSSYDAPAAIPAPTYVLTLSCPDRIGIVAQVASFLVERACNILDSAQFGDAENGAFFLRTAFQPTDGARLEDLRAGFAPRAKMFSMQTSWFDLGAKVPTVIMVSRFSHCLNDLLFRWSIGALPIDIRGVISNHPDFRKLVEDHGLPFHYLPVTPEAKAQQEGQLMKIIEDERVELVVLARYMQVLSANLCRQLAGRAINIHHSFLPSFKGALPYKRAHERGVKLIGATAHYVTENLDEGPIIEQSVERVHHALSVADYAAVGRDVEALVLARAVKWYAERRILINGHRTVVFA